MNFESENNNPQNTNFLMTTTKLINPLMIVWLIIQLLIVLFTMNSSDNEGLILFWMALPCLILNCIGVMIILSGKPKTGSILFMIGSVVFVPIGLIGAMGARKILNKIKEDKFLETL
ncbi:hypothetical protein [Aquimarina sediminis]|uniref:hypothetical protein n=1 Tax=Aquimarina sediminis TaxID=2070536 RepID=UPI000CA08F94|nr:hypothetical protein [Aquimarina sediminis]